MEFVWLARKRENEPSALAGNRTRVNCLEGSYAHHYTTNACLVQLSKIIYKSNRGYDSATVF